VYDICPCVVQIFTLWAMQFLQSCNINIWGNPDHSTLAKAIEYRVQPGKWHSQRVSTSVATSRDKMNGHTSHGDSPYRLRKKFGSTWTMLTPHTHQFKACYLYAWVCVYPVFYGNWPMKCENLVFSCKGSQFIEGLFCNLVTSVSYFFCIHD